MASAFVARKATMCDLVSATEFRRAISFLKEHPENMNPKIPDSYGDALKESGFNQGEPEYNAAVLVLQSWNLAMFDRNY